MLPTLQLRDHGKLHISYQIDKQGHESSDAHRSSEGYARHGYMKDHHHRLIGHVSNHMEYLNEKYMKQECFSLSMGII